MEWDATARSSEEVVKQGTLSVPMGRLFSRGGQNFLWGNILFAQNYTISPSARLSMLFFITPILLLLSWTAYFKPKNPVLSGIWKFLVCSVFSDLRYQSDKQGLPEASVDHVTKERFRLTWHSLPSFVERKVVDGRLNEVEDLFALEDVIPHRRSTEINVKVWKTKNYDLIENDQLWFYSAFHKVNLPTVVQFLTWANLHYCPSFL